MRITIERLRDNAKLNLCDDCYKHYLALIEPSVKKITYDILDDWRSTESYITRIVMKDCGVFKSDIEVQSIDNWDEQFANEVDINMFNIIKLSSFSSKINYLKKRKLIPESCYGILEKVNDIRNRVHEDPIVYEFGRKDHELFHTANAILANLHMAFFGNWPQDIKNNIINNCEKAAAKQLENICARAT
jgi:hypothetical protein